MISIVICSYNGSERIIPCLQAIICQDNPPDFEVLVIDNASTDDTSTLVKNFFELHFPHGVWKVIQEATPGLLYARKSGLKAANYGWVLFCDDDNVLFPDFLFQCAKILPTDPGIGVMGSQGIPQFLGSKPDWFDRYSTSFAVGPQAVADLGRQNLVHVYGACSLYLKQPLVDLFERGFVPVLSDRSGNQLQSGGDVEWCWLMQLMGYKVAYSVKLQFTHQLPASRLSWEYYTRLKKGISGSSGLLSAYTFYFCTSFRPLIRFIFHYFLKNVSSVVLYLKYLLLWKGNPIKPENQLSFAILEAQMKAYFKQGKTAFSHYRQLQRYFGS